MHKIDSPSAVPTLPTPNPPSTPGFFAHGSAGGTPYTVLTSDWANAVQMELCNVITGAGIALSKTAQNQLLLAVQSLIASGGGGGGSGGTGGSGTGGDGTHFQVLFKQVIPANTPVNTTYLFTVPATALPPVDCFWTLGASYISTPALLGNVMALNGLEGYSVSTSSVNCKCHVLVDIGDGNGPTWRNIGNANMAGISQPSFQNFAVNPVDVPGINMDEYVINHIAGTTIQVRLTLVVNSPNTHTVALSFGGNIVAPSPAVAGVISSAGIGGSTGGSTGGGTGGATGVTNVAVVTPGTSTFADPGYGTLIYVSLYGAGGSGGPGSFAGGGCGGGGGAHRTAIFRRSDLTFPITLTVGTGGAAVAGIAQTSSGGGGATPNGRGGGNTSFGSYLRAFGGGGGSGGNYYSSSIDTLGMVLPGGGGGGTFGPPNTYGGGTDPLNPTSITGYGGEPFGTFPIIHGVGYGSSTNLNGSGGGGGSSNTGSAATVQPLAGSAEWGGGAGAPNLQLNTGPLNTYIPPIGNTGGASIWGGAGGGSGGCVGGPVYVAYAGGIGGQVNAYATVEQGNASMPPGGPAGGAANTNAGMGTAKNGDATFGGQGGPGGGAKMAATGTVVGLPGGKGGNCGGGGGGGGQGYNSTGGGGTGGTSGAGGNGAIYITVI